MPNDLSPVCAQERSPSSTSRSKSRRTGSTVRTTNGKTDENQGDENAKGVEPPL